MARGRPQRHKKTNQNKLTPVLQSSRHFESKEHLGKGCVFRHGVNNLQSSYFRNIILSLSLLNILNSMSLDRSVYRVPLNEDNHRRLNSGRNFLRTVAPANWDSL